MAISTKPQLIARGIKALAVTLVAAAVLAGCGAAGNSKNNSAT